MKIDAKSYKEKMEELMSVRNDIDKLGRLTPKMKWKSNHTPLLCKEMMLVVLLAAPYLVVVVALLRLNYSLAVPLVVAFGMVLVVPNFLLIYFQLGECLLVFVEGAFVAVSLVLLAILRLASQDSVLVVIAFWLVLFLLLQVTVFLRW